jgi:DNA repair protein RecO (recombination protein O)
MPTFSTPAILLRRSVYGDYDLIVTFLTLSKGKLTVIAKNAKKSRKRFAGLLELFALLNMDCRPSKGQGMPVLEAAALENPFSGIRGDIMKTAYASYWAELINLWLEDEKPQAKIYHLLRYCLNALDTGVIGHAQLSIIFQLRFLSFSGLSPDFSECNQCRTGVDEMPGDSLVFELAKGGILCKGCSSNAITGMRLARSTVKQLLWIQSNDLNKAERLKFSRAALDEGLHFLEKFIVFHIGREPKSLKFLRNLRAAAPM